MTPEQFAYWMQGFAEIHGEPPAADQWQVIKDHLAEVFAKVTPNRAAQNSLNTPLLGQGQCLSNGQNRTC